MDLFIPTVSCLEEISHASSEAWNRETRNDAHIFLLGISQFTFFVSLVLTQRVLAYTKGLSVKLQGFYVDVANAHQQIECVKDVLKGTGASVDSFHDLVYLRACF